MRILFLGQYFPPEMGAPAARTFEHARQWVKDGHRVIVLTGFPNHPTGVIPPEYRGRIFQREESDGIAVWRTWLWATRNAGFARRTISYISFMLSATLAAIIRRTDCDVVVATSPQFFTAIAGYLVSLVKRRPFVLEIRDLWPEAIVSVGLLQRDSVITRGLEKLELFLYRRADCVITVAEGARDDIVRRGIDAKKVFTVRNGADLSQFNPGDRQNEVRETLGLGEKFVVCYVGTHGMAHGLETVLQAADRLRERQDIAFLLLGEGAEKEKLVRLASELRLPNLQFLDPEPKHRMPLYLAATDACLVPLRKRRLFEGTIPSKIFEAMASARPIILGVRGEAARIIDEAQSGLPIMPEDPEALASAILELADDRERCRELGENGARYVREHFDRTELARKLVEIAGRFVSTGARG